MAYLDCIGFVMEVGAAGFIVFRAWQTARVWKANRAHFKTWDGVDAFVDAVADSATGQFRDQGIAFAVLVVGMVLQRV